MVETSKQVRVDNWGIFFLSRLQVFFNKTDYCDLTLQFEGNVQLKVHRLVMNACTEYFQLLEQTCEVVDDVLLMPSDLQADVILPIVNFMYTGMLEFQMSIFDRLYKTAELMNITVLLKLLDAQKQPHNLSKSVVSKVPPTYNLQGKKISPKVDKILPATLPGRKLPVWKRKMAPSPAAINPTSSFSSESRRSSSNEHLSLYDNAPKPTRFEWPDEDLKDFSLLDSSFDNISYTSKPLLTQEDELRASTSTTFDDLKYAPCSNTKKSKEKDYNNSSTDMEDLKNYVKEQKIRSGMVDYEDDGEVDNDLDPDYVPSPAIKRKSQQFANTPTKKVRFNVSEKENKETKINITPSGKSDVDHSKIISEVLKKYPHLVKKNKNIRLKILAKNKSPTETNKQPTVKVGSKVKVQMKSVVKQMVPVKSESKVANNEDGPWTCDKCMINGENIEFVLYYLYRKHMTDVHNEKTDSRMCKYCGHKSNKHNMLMYHQYTKHGIKPPPIYNFPKCTQCPYVALTETLMIKHKLTHTKFDLQCSECKVGFNSETSLKHHIQITGHTGKTGRNNYDCQYCTKHYQTGANLFSHIRLQHRDEARRDGIVSIDEDDALEDEIEEVDEHTISDKVKILSNVKLPQPELDHTGQLQTIPSSEAEALNNVASGIATSLGLVDIVVLDDNQQYILHPNDQQLVTQQALANNPEFILPNELHETHTFVQNQAINQVITTEHNVITQSMLGGSDIASTDELVMVLTDHDYNDGNNEILTNDNSNIVVLYSHPVEGQENQFITSQGNLMLNSETGMLEIRNSNIAPNSESIVSQNTVESIEMIQREIESHHPIKDVTSTSEEIAPVVLEVPHNQLEEIQYVENVSDDKIDEVISEETVGVTEAVDVIETEAATNEGNVVVLTDGEIIGETEELTTDVTDAIVTEGDVVDEIDSTEPEPMEVDEDCTNSDTVTEIKQDELNKSQSETEEQVEIQNVIEKAGEEIVEKSKSPVPSESQQVDELPALAIILEEESVPETSTQNQSVIEEVQEVVERDVIPEIAKLDEYIPEPMEVDGKVSDKTDDEITNEIIEENKIVELENSKEIIEQNEPIEVSQDVTDSSENKVEPDKIANAAETTDLAETTELEENAVEEITQNSAIEESVTIENGTIVQNNEVKPTQTDSIETNDLPPEENTTENIEAPNVETENILTPPDENVPTPDENNSNIESTESTNATEGVESLDEDSQKSEELVKNSEEKIKAAKNSILDDWEDTEDSQQSDHGVKSVNTVNKLINDWDDD